MTTDNFEIDPSGMATQQQKWLEEWEANNPTKAFARYCEEYPWAPECKMYDV